MKVTATRLEAIWLEVEEDDKIVSSFLRLINDINEDEVHAIWYQNEEEGWIGLPQAESEALEEVYEDKIEGTFEDGREFGDPK